MRFIARMIVRHRARQCVFSALRFAERLRKQDSEFAPSYSATLDAIGDEMAMLARKICRNEADRRALLEGLTAAFERMYANNPNLARRVTARLAPRVLSADSTRELSTAWMQMAV